MGDTIMVLGRSQCREGGAENNNCSGKRKDWGVYRKVTGATGK
jgi:hypothetical protein